ncbi:hypothetical protein CRUP_001854, partial [Coryphaenoides rupestris]
MGSPWLRYNDTMRLWNKYKVTSIPSLVFVDAATGKVVCRNGLLVVRDDPKGLEFPWGPKPFAEVVAGPLLRNNRQTADSGSLEGHYVGVYFSAHWDSFQQYFSEMPWLAVPYSDEARRSRLNRLYGIQGIPTLILLDAEGHVITRQGRVEVLNDPECRLFPWHPRPVLELSEANAVQLHEGPCLVLFVDAEEEGELEPAKELLQPVAEKLMAKSKAKDEEMPLLFFVAGEEEEEKEKVEEEEVEEVEVGEEEDDGYSPPVLAGWGVSLGQTRCPHACTHGAPDQLLNVSVPQHT